jgi:hypothetical protein
MLRNHATYNKIVNGRELITINIFHMVRGQKIIALNLEESTYLPKESPTYAQQTSWI